jgi:hypothetical protein
MIGLLILGIFTDLTIYDRLKEGKIDSLLVNFPQSSGLMNYNGCYVGERLDSDSTRSRYQQYRHFNISNTTGIETEARFGFCEEAKEGKGRWVFFTNPEDPCDDDDDAQIAQSIKVDKDDIDRWTNLLYYTPPNKPFESFYPKLEVNKDICKPFLAEGEL